MFYIYQLRTPSFPIGLVKTESGFIVRSVETGLGRWTLVVTVISVDAYPFLAFSDLTCHNQEASPSAGKNTGVVLVPCLCMEVCPYSFFKWCGCFWGCWVSFVTTDEFSVRVSENQTLLTFLLCVRQTWMTQSAFTCNRDEISSQDETHLGM